MTIIDFNSGGGINFTGSTTCSLGSTCTKVNEREFLVALIYQSIYASLGYFQCISEADSDTLSNKESSTEATSGPSHYWFSFGDSYTQTGFDYSAAQPNAANALG